MFLKILPDSVALVISLVFSLATNVSKKVYNRNAPSSKQSVYLFNCIMSVFCGLFIFLQSIDFTGENPFSQVLNISLASVLLGVLFGILTMVQTVTFMFALALGPMSYTSVIVSLSTLIASFSGVFYGETIDIFQYIGMAIMVVCIILSTKTGDVSQEKKSASIKWLLLSLISCLTNGGVGVMQKVHQSSSHKDELPIFLLSCFAFMAISSFILYFIEKKLSNKRDGEESENFIPSGKQFAIAAICGSVLSVPHVFNLYLAGRMPSAIFFPLINTGSLVLTSIAAIFVFKDNLSKKQYIGLLLGIISTLFVSGTVSAWIS